MSDVDVTDAKRALAALASEREAPGTANERVETVVSDAERALESLPDAARFCDAWGIDALRDAVAEAERRERTTLAGRGRRALTVLVRVRRAVAGDHFHSGHGRDLRPDRERPTRQ